MPNGYNSYNYNNNYGNMNYGNQNSTANINQALSSGAANFFGAPQPQNPAYDTQNINQGLSANLGNFFSATTPAGNDYSPSKKLN